MFGLFGKKRKPATAMDALIRALYGDNPPKKTADVQHAAKLAADELLGGAFDKPTVTRIATELNDGPIPYSTHDLAASVALNLFKSVLPENRHLLFETQLMARMTVHSWSKEGKVVTALAQSFENVLYDRYKPSPPGTESINTQAPVSREIAETMLGELAEILAHNATTFPPEEVLTEYLAGAGYGHIPAIRLRVGMSVANQVLNIWLINERVPATPGLKLLVDLLHEAFHGRFSKTPVCVGDLVVHPDEIKQVGHYIGAATNQEISSVQSIDTTLWMLLRSIYPYRQMAYREALDVAANSELPDGCGPTTCMALELATHLTGDTIDSGGESFVGFAAGLEAFLDNYAKRTRATIPAVR
ncbi:MAG: hypothetical protein WD793_10525 [Steroidobacteraceae bacterium]